MMMLLRFVYVKEKTRKNVIQTGLKFLLSIQNTYNW